MIEDMQRLKRIANRAADAPSVYVSIQGRGSGLIATFQQTFHPEYVLHLLQHIERLESEANGA